MMVRRKRRKNLEVSEILEKGSSRVSLRKRPKKTSNEEQRHESSHKYVDIAGHQGTKTMVMITE